MESDNFVTLEQIRIKSGKAHIERLKTPQTLNQSLNFNMIKWFRISFNILDPFLTQYICIWYEFTEVLS